MITNEAIEAALNAYYGNDVEHGWMAREQMEAAITAAFAAMPGPAVKALEWHRQPPYHVARVFGNLYAIEVWDGGVTLSGIIGRKEFSDFNSAKAAAQADYEARILSAITPAPDLASENESLPQDVVNLVIAAREFWDVAMDESDESAALDCALEAFSSRVPYENDPEEDRAALDRK